MSQTFHNRLRDKITSDIAQYTDQYFELAQQTSRYNDQEQEFQYENRNYLNAPSSKKTAWVFFLVLTALIAVIDYASISNFISYLQQSSGGVIGTLIKVLGWAIFICFELGVGFIYITTKKPGLKFIAGVIAGALCLLPAFLIYSGYAIHPNKTQLLLYKTIALMIVSILIHVFFFISIGEVWQAINYVAFCFKKAKRKYRNPQRKMKPVKKELQELYPDFDHHVTVNTQHEQIPALLHNRAWYLKAKLQQGDSDMDYDLSDYDPNTSYAPYSTENTNHVTIS